MVTFSIKACLDTAIKSGKLSYDSVAFLSEEESMNKIISQFHKFAITAPAPGAKDQRYVTYVEDPTKPNGRRQIRKSKTELEKFLVKFYCIGETNAYTFGNAFSDWIEYKKLFTQSSNVKKRVSPSTIRRIQRDYDKYIRGTLLDKTPLSKLTTGVLENALVSMIKTTYYSNERDRKAGANGHRMYEASCKNVLGYIKNMLEYSCRQDKMANNPWLKIDTDSLLALTDLNPVDSKSDSDRILTLEELCKLYDAVRRQEVQHPLYMPNYAIELAILTGMRVGEISALHWSDIRNGFIHIDWSEHRLDYDDRTFEMVIGEPKNRRHRVIPVTPEIEELLDRIKSLGLVFSEDFIFVNSKGKRHTGHDISSAIYRRGDEAGISRTSIHGIRRTYSSMMQANGCSRLVVSTLLGHTPKTNEDHYSFDTMSKAEKSELIQAMSSNVIKFKPHLLVQKKPHAL